MAMASAPAPFEKEFRVPDKAIGIVIGKGGTTLKTLQRISGISSVRVTSNGRVKIRADSEEALQTVASYIEELVSFSFDKNSGYFPDFFAFCFCKSLENPLLAINRVCFEEKSKDISNVSERDRQSRKSFFSLKSGAEVPCQDSICGSDIDSLSVDFSHKTSITEVYFYSHWGFSVYEAKLLGCLEPVLCRQQETMRSVKIIVRFGKQLFYGSSWSELQHGSFMSVEHLQDLCRRERLDQRFSTACSEAAIEELKLHLQTLGYVKMLSRRKITVHVAVLQPRHLLQFNVSVRCESVKGEDRVLITRVRSQPKRHGFVTFCREGQGTADFRLGIGTHGTEVKALPEMVEWIEKGWRNRTPDQLLVFDPPGKFQVMRIRYKEAETYMSQEWKLRIARVRDGNRMEIISERWECGLSSRWFKRKGDGVAEDMQSAMENVGALVNEAAALGQLMNAREP
jgi:hypothetical protein